jgi:NTP pyrophosphatase (non-canonical NTP hydrolase)
MTISELVTRAHDNAVKHGFWNPTPAFGTAIALIHSELSEALEEERAGRPNFWFHCLEGDPSLPCDPTDETDCFQFGHEDRCQHRGKKPEGVAVELADAVIRIADLCGHLGIDLEAAIDLKMAYNETRPFKHGKRF